MQKKFHFLMYHIKRISGECSDICIMNIKQIVGDNIRFIRQKRKMSQEWLALDARMSRTYVGEVERAQKNISIERLTRLAEVLNVGPDALLIREYYRSVE